MSLKHRIKPVLRSLGLMLLVTRLKYWNIYLRYYQEGRAYKAAHPDLLFPPSYMLYIAYGLNFKHYIEDGKRTATWLKDQFEGHIQTEGRILDWGCGPARITRHLPSTFPGWQVIGSDYDEATIAWCQSAFPDIQFILNDLQPPLKLADASINAAISISIFTHLSEKGHYAWRDELARVLAAGGMLFVTTQGKVFQFQMNSSEKAAFSRDELVIRATGPEGHKVYGAYQPEAFMQKFWEPYFEVVQHHAGALSGEKPMQDFWILKRKGY